MTEETSETGVSEGTGVERALDIKEARILQARHPGISIEEIGTIYNQIKRSLLQGARIRHLIPPLALNLTNQELRNPGSTGHLEGGDGEELLVGFEKTLDERDIDRLCERYPSLERTEILRLYETKKAELSQGASIREYIPLLAMNLTNEVLRQKRASLEN